MHRVFRILHAPFFIVPLFTEGIDRTAGYAFPADVFSKMQAIGMMIIVGPGARRDFNFCDDRADAHCLAHRGYETVAQAKGPEAGRIGCVPLGPV